MKVDPAQVKVIHNPGAERFEIHVDGHLAVLEYKMRGNRIYFTHTGVPRPVEGQGLANRLAEAGLEYAREKTYTVVPACEFMEVYLRRHPEYRDLVRR